MIIYAWIYIIINILAFGVILGQGRWNWLSFFRFLLILPFIGRVLGWW
jgi:hypothetical protein